MKIKVLVFGSEGITEHTTDKFHYRCHHNFKSNFLSFEEPLLFEVSNEQRKKDRYVELKVSDRLKNMFLYEDFFFHKILIAFPTLSINEKYTNMREAALLLKEHNPIGYDTVSAFNPYEVKLKGFLIHLAMGFYSSSNKNPNGFSYTSMMLWDRYKPIWIHVNDLGKFVNYLLDYSFFSLEKKTVKGKKLLELKIKWRDSRY